MTRTVPSTVQTASNQSTTRPIYLVRMGFATEVRAATYDAAISWNSENWVASGIEVRDIDGAGGVLEFPLGDSDPWLALVNGEGAIGIAVEVYERQTDETASPVVSDAVQIFDGYMDEVDIDARRMRVTLIEASRQIMFPPYTIERQTNAYNYLLPRTTRVYLGTDVIEID